MSNKFWIGLFFLAFGIGFLLHEFHIIDFPEILSAWWPLIIIFIGIIQLVNRTSIASSLLFLFVGVPLLLNQLLDVNLITYLWPLIFIFIGFSILFTRVKREKRAHTNEELNTSVILSGAEIKSRSENFQGGSIMTVLGGAEIDLRDITIPEEGATMDLTTVLGGISIIVPEHVHVEFSGFPILGGWEDSTSIRSEEDRQVVLKMNCLTILGGVEVNN